MMAYKGGLLLKWVTFSGCKCGQHLFQQCPMFSLNIIHELHSSGLEKGCRAYWGMLKGCLIFLWKAYERGKGKGFDLRADPYRMKHC